MKKQPFIRKKYQIWILLLCTVVCTLKPLTVCAAEGSVLFGSEAYEWKQNEVCPLGVYITSPIPIERYSIYVEYDSTMLTYLNGADHAEGNRLYLEGTGNDTTCKRMLHFQPTEAGETSVQIVSAVGVGLSMNIDGTLHEEPIQVTQAVTAPIHIPPADSTLLKELRIENVEWDTDFSPDIYEYHLEASAELERLSLHYETENEQAIVTVSDPDLKEGSNRITITVEYGETEPTVYTLYVEREMLEEDTFKEAEKETTELSTQAQNTVSTENFKQEKDQPKEAYEDQMTEVYSAEKQNKNASSVSGREADARISSGLTIGFLLVLCLMCFYTVYNLEQKYRHRRFQSSRAENDDKKSMNWINLDQTVIDVRHVTMNFRMAQDESSSLKEYLIRMLKGQNHYRTFTALKDISLEVKQSEVLGIIGTNGSGKSTLLKLIAGALQPTSGEIITDTAKVQMLTLGTGFDMELTARENVYLNGSIIGYTKEYIDEKYDDIVAFGELEGFMDERMKNFSSGMVSRLGFAIATMRDTPDILILDEVLSVGDMFFRKKSEKRIREMINSGSTVLIVSHSADVIKKNCDRAVWIEKGELRMIGKPDEVCQAYAGMET